MISVADKTMPECPWSVLHVVANHERRVAQHLAAHSLEHYLPLYKDRSRWTDRVVTLERPLFAGYVFVRFTPLARTVVLSIPSVLHLLGDGQHETISAIEINQIHRGLENGCALRPQSNVVVGTQVRIVRGIFEGAEGIVTKLCKQCEVIMVLQATGQYFSLKADLADIEVLHSELERNSK